MHKHEPIESHPDQGERGPNEAQGGTIPHPGRKARCVPDPISVALSPRAGAMAGRNRPAGLLACSLRALNVCGTTVAYAQTQVPWGATHAECRPFLSPRPWPPAAAGGPLAECPSVCEVLPEGVPGEAPASACCGVHQGGGLPSGLIRWGQASGHPPAGTGSLTLVWSGGGQGPGG